MSYPDYQVEIRIFGSVQISNRNGIIREPREHTLVWLMLKYLLVNADRQVPQIEMMEQLWPNGEERKRDGAMRTCLSRLRSELSPLHLDGKNGLVFYGDGFYSLNPEYEIDLDLSLWRMLTHQACAVPANDPKGLLYCKNALRLYQNEVFEQTRDTAWLVDLRERCHKELRELCRNALQRMKEINDYSILPLLSERAIAFLPEDGELHKEIMFCMVEQKMWDDFVWYRRQMNRYSHIDWLNALEGKPETEYGDLDVGVRLLGTFEIENKWGRIIEEPGVPMVWLPLKYFLSQRTSFIEEEEFQNVLWPGEERDFDKYRRRRMRDVLIPLHLDGVQNGLYLFHASCYGLNPTYNILSDTETVEKIMDQLRSIPEDAPEGLQLCIDALTLFRGRYLAYTPDAPWFHDIREHFDQVFADLNRETMQRTKATGDDRAIPLLLNRIAAIKS